MILDRVDTVVTVWSGAAQRDPTTKLSDHWEATRNLGHDGIACQPDGINLLLGKLAAEFRKPGTVRKDTSVLTANDFKPGGQIDTIEDLANAVVACLDLPEKAERAGGE